MGYIKIYCNSCKSYFDVYENENIVMAGTCPHCGNAVSDEIWIKEVLPAYEYIAYANEHDNNFKFGFVSKDHRYPNLVRAISNGVYTIKKFFENTGKVAQNAEIK